MISNPDDSSPTIVTLNPISSLETKLLARFDKVRNKLKIKNLQEEKERLWIRVSFLNKKVISLESRHNILEQYGRRNNLQITGISDSKPQKRFRK